MIVGGAISIAQGGLHRSGQQLHAAAQNVASGQLEPRDVVDLRTAEHSFDANAAVLRTAEDMANSLLDVKA